MRTFLIYGTTDSDVSDVRVRVADALGVQFEEHESLYWGVYYRATGPGLSGEIRILRNFGDDVDDLPYPEFKQAAAIVELNDCTGETARLVLAKIPELELLRDTRA